MEKMTLKRVLAAVCLATMTLTATMAQTLQQRILLQDVGVDSAMLNQLSDSAVVELTRMAIEHNERFQQEERRHMEQMEMMYNQRKSSDTVSPERILFLIGMFSVIPVIVIFLYKLLSNRSRRKREEANNEMLLQLVSNGQTLTPELVEAITRDSTLEKKEKELTMNTSLRKLFLGFGLIVFAIVFHCLITFPDPFSPVLAILGIFYAAQGLAGYLTLRQAKQTSDETPQTIEQTEKSESEISETE